MRPESERLLPTPSVLPSPEDDKHPGQVLAGAARAFLISLPPRPVGWEGASPHPPSGSSPRPPPDGGQALPLEAAHPPWPEQTRMTHKGG